MSFAYYNFTYRAHLERARDGNFKPLTEHQFNTLAIKIQKELNNGS